MVRVEVLGSVNPNPNPNPNRTYNPNPNIQVDKIQFCVRFNRFILFNCGKIFDTSII